MHLSYTDFGIRIGVLLTNACSVSLKNYSAVYRDISMHV